MEVREADIYGAGTPHPEINKWSCLPHDLVVTLSVWGVSEQLLSGMGCDSSQTSDWIICVRIIGVHTQRLFFGHARWFNGVACSMWPLVAFNNNNTQVLLVLLNIKNATACLSHGGFRVSLVFLWRCFGSETELILHSELSICCQTNG